MTNDMAFSNFICPHRKLSPGQTWTTVGTEMTYQLLYFTLSEGVKTVVSVALGMTDTSVGSLILSAMHG